MSEIGDECPRYGGECSRYNDECPNSMTTSVVICMFEFSSILHQFKIDPLGKL